ncbi:MAG: hypothetical protein ABSC53_15710 [Bacteroidota bacterium]|jgi:hypothetical protein
MPLSSIWKEGDSSVFSEDFIMWRALFLAMGIFLIIVGVQCLGVAQFTLKIRDEATESTSIFDSTPALGAQKQVIPPPWAPWSLMSTGAVVCLYSFTIPKRVAGK